MEGVVQIKRNRDQPRRFSCLTQPCNRHRRARDSERRRRIDRRNFKPRAAFFQQWRYGFRCCANRRHAPGAARGMLMPAARHNQRRRLIKREYPRRLCRRHFADRMADHHIRRDALFGQRRQNGDLHREKQRLGKICPRKLRFAYTCLDQRGGRNAKLWRQRGIGGEYTTAKGG